MKRLTVCWSMLLAFALVGGTAAYSQDLGEIARQEREKQKQKQEKVPKQVKTFTNADLEKVSGGHVSSVSTDEAPAPVTEGAEKAPGAEAEGVAPDGQAAGEEKEKDKPEEKGEQYWRDRAKQVRQQQTRSKERVDLLLMKQSGLNNAYYNMSDAAQRDALGVDLANLNAEIEEARQEAIDANQAWLDLEDEARKGGALPGWLR